MVDWPPPGVAGAEFVNRALGGQTSAQVLERYERHVAPLRPDVVVVQLGVNDLVDASFFPGERRWLEERCATQLRALVARASAQGAVVVLTTVFPPGLRPSFPEREPDGLLEAVRRLNVEVRRLATPTVLVLDAAAVVAGPDGRVSRSYALDPLHLTTAGYAALNARLQPLLDSVVASRRAVQERP